MNMNSAEFRAKATQEVERVGKLPEEEWNKARQEAYVATTLALQEMETDEKLQDSAIRDILTSVIFTERMSMGLPITPLLTSTFTMGYALGWMRAKQAQVLKEV